MLSEKAKVILQLIAEGRDYGQILALHPGYTYKDIFDAAAEALTLADKAKPDYAERLAEIKAKHPRAYEPWSDEEDRDLELLWGEGKSVKDMAAHFGRQPSAIQSRLKKLGRSS
ncbi:MAG: hypothetical protein AMXMBFR84_16660 [Candidatus Hydrogenedentota bacterium]